MKKLLYVLWVFILLLPGGGAIAAKKQLRIASGIPGGTYRTVYAANLAKLLRMYDVFQHKTGGSRQNLALLDSGEADVAFVQADAYAAWRAQDSERVGRLKVVGQLGDECVYIAIRRNGHVQDLEGLSREVDGRPARIAVGSEQGGMGFTWDYLVTVKPQLGSAEIVYVGDTLAVNQLGVGKYDAVGWVTDPKNLDHNMLRAALANDELAFLQLADPSIPTALPDGTEIHKVKTVKLTRSWRSPRIKTLCTSALVMMRSDADPDLVKRISDLVSLKRYLIAPPSK